MPKIELSVDDLKALVRAVDDAWTYNKEWIEDIGNAIDYAEEVRETEEFLDYLEELRAIIVKPTHTRDEDCESLDAERGTCAVCGVYHGEPCQECGARAYHQEGCSLAEIGG